MQDSSRTHDKHAETAVTNALRHETSPYLLQHTHNPVAWYPWGEAALEKARQEQKPIFLSIGYSACHWCHVMAHESFEDEAIAAILNEHFVNIKVDREERPDLDDIYMAATVAQTGRGGWPMSVFLTPELEPFYCGTYFPPTDRHGLPGFPKLLRHIIKLWVEQREEVVKTARIITDHIAEQSVGPDDAVERLDDRPLRLAGEQLRGSYDPQFGGFGGAPKFPPSASISLLLRLHLTRNEPELLEMAVDTLTRMANGGIYDQVGGGFHRYSVDEKWRVPHFEKMLYDNAQLADVYLEAYQYTRNDYFARIARETLDYVLRDLRHPEGPFYSAEDADSEGEEGKFYLWRKEEILDCLGPGEGDAFCREYNIKDQGNFRSPEPYHEGLNIPYRAIAPNQIAEALPEFLAKMIWESREQVLARLREYREKRVRPGLDDKILCSWNGLMISALAKGAGILGEDRYREAAVSAADFILTHMRDETGGLLRTHRNGKSHLPGYLDDYAFFGLGLVDLYEATFEPQWLEAAETLVTEMCARFLDEKQQGFYFTGATHKHLIVRTRPTYDGAEPSGNSVAVQLLFRLGRLLGDQDQEALASEVLAAQHDQLCRAPMAYARMLCALHDALQEPLEIALVGPRHSEALWALAAVLHGQYLPWRQVAQAHAEEADSAHRFPWIPEPRPGSGEVEARVCRGYTCDRPVDDPEALRKQLRVLLKG